MIRMAAAALTAALLAGGATAALAQTATKPPATAPNAAAPAPATTSPAAMAMKPHRVARHARDLSGDRDTKALNLLEAKGYTGIQQFHPVGKDFEAVVSQGGKPTTVRVDPDAGTILNRA